VPRRDVDLCDGEYYHFYNRGHDRERIFYERTNYVFFLRGIWKYLVPVLEVVAYCLMPTHYHFLVLVKEDAGVCQSPDIPAVSRAMQRFSISYTKAMNKRYERVGALYQGAFRAKHVDEDRYLMHLSRYIHLNPVFAGLVKRPEDWEFSSYSDYVGVREGRLPSPEIVLSQFASGKAYQAFVESYIPQERGVIAELLFD